MNMELGPEDDDEKIDLSCAPSYRRYPRGLIQSNHLESIRSPGGDSYDETINFQTSRRSKGQHQTVNSSPSSKSNFDINQAFTKVKTKK